MSTLSGTWNALPGSEKSRCGTLHTWCKLNGYNFSEQKTVVLPTNDLWKFPLVPRTDTYKLLVREAVTQLNAISCTVETYCAEIDRLASRFLEYELIMDMTGVGKSTWLQINAEIRRSMSLCAAKIAGWLFWHRSNHR